MGRQAILFFCYGKEKFLMNLKEIVDKVLAEERNGNDFLIKEGYEVYRISWNELKSQKGKELMKEKIDKFICYYNT